MHIGKQVPGPLHKMTSGCCSATSTMEATKAWRVVRGVVSQDWPTERERGTVRMALGLITEVEVEAEDEVKDVLTMPSLRASEAARTKTMG